MSQALAPSTSQSMADPGASRRQADILSLDQVKAMLAMDDGFAGEFGILAPYLRKATATWAQEIPRRIVVDETTQDAMTIRDLNRLSRYVEIFVTEMTLGQFGSNFEAALDGIAVIMRKHGINPCWATAPLALAFDAAQQQIYSETRNTNNRVFPAALRCITKIAALSIHILGRRDHELNEATPQIGAPIT